MILENDKSYRLEILIVYAQNKFVYAHGFNFFLNRYKISEISFLTICLFQILREISHFKSARQKNEMSNMHENLIDYTKNILIHIYDIKFVSNCLIF